MKVACETLREHLPKCCEFEEPAGGYFIWIKFPEHVDINDFNSYCKEHYMVSAIAGNDFSAENRFKNYIRLSIAFHNVDKIKSALLTLCKAYNEYSAL